MKNNKKSSTKIDVVSIVMTVIFFAIVVGGIAAILIASQSRNANNEVQPEAAVPEYDISETEPVQEELVAEETDAEERYETYEELADRFMQICEEGDTEAMYGLYYKDLLSERVSESTAAKEEFDAVMKDNMLHITYFEEYPYGEGDLIMNTPAGYVNELYYRANEKSFPYTDVEISDCVDLRAYFANGAYIDFMLANIEGYWYAVV